ncbi:MAG: hypothetical protein ACI9F9_001215, partial [Candidatus Paceibacteria bacterium]
MAQSKSALATPTLFPGANDEDVTPKKASKKKPASSGRRSNAVEMASKQRDISVSE